MNKKIGTYSPPSCSGGNMILNQSTQKYECKCPQDYINKNGQCIQNSQTSQPSHYTQHMTSSYVPKFIS